MPLALAFFLICMFILSCAQKTSYICIVCIYIEYKCVCVCLYVCVHVFIISIELENKLYIEV